MFGHDIVPDYLRTKPDPEVEEQEKQLSTEAARIGPDVAQVSFRWFLIVGFPLFNPFFKKTCVNRNRSKHSIRCVLIYWKS